MKVELIIGLTSAVVTLIIGVFGGLLTYRFNKNSKQHFEQTEKIEKDRLMKELFTEFNLRYDKINNPLNKIANKSFKKWQNYDDKKQSKYYGVIIDFFNICAEEYYWFKEGRLDKKIWNAWHKGMNDIFNKGEIIQMLWEEECQNEGFKSYYISNKNEIFINS